MKTCDYYIYQPFNERQWEMSAPANQKEKSDKKFSLIPTIPSEIKMRALCPLVATAALISGIGNIVLGSVFTILDIVAPGKFTEYSMDLLEDGSHCIARIVFQAIIFLNTNAIEDLDPSFRKLSGPITPKVAHIWDKKCTEWKNSDYWVVKHIPTRLGFIANLMILPLCQLVDVVAASYFTLRAVASLGTSKEWNQRSYDWFHSAGAGGPIAFSHLRGAILGESF